MPSRVARTASAVRSSRRSRSPVAAWQTPAAHTGAGVALLDAARAQGLRGVVAKRLDSTYEPGTTSDAWVETRIEQQASDERGPRRTRTGRAAQRGLGLAVRGHIGFSRAVRVGDRVLVSGTAPCRPTALCDADAGKQAERCLQIIDTALAGAGASLADVVRTRMFLIDAADVDAVGRAHAHVFGAVRPAATMVVVAALLDARWRVEIEAEAVVSPRRDPEGPVR